MRGRLLLLLLPFLFACEMPHVFRPLRLYDLSSGTTIQVYLQNTSDNTGMLASAKTQEEQFHGEFVLYDRLAPGTKLPGTFYGQSSNRALANTSDADFAELYGFGKDSNAKPAGTAILVGNKGTVIEVVLYRIATNLEYGDGVAKDNKGHRYRVFLSMEKQ